nr:hypothetical protein [Moorena producens]
MCSKGASAVLGVPPKTALHPDSRLPTPDSRLPTPDSRLPTLINPGLSTSPN